MTVLLFPQQRNGPTYWLSSPQTFADICHPNCTIDPLSFRIVLPLIFRARFKIPQTYPRICPRSTVLPRAATDTCLFQQRGWRHSGLKLDFSCDSPGDYTHLLCDTDGDDRAAGVPRGQCTHSSSATWQRLPSRSEEVSLSICVHEVTTLQGRAATRTHNLHFENRFLFSPQHSVRVQMN